MLMELWCLSVRLQKLFKDLHFEVKVHNDVNANTLESLFLTMHILDHTNYDAFVCCILTHGKLGVIYTSDGKEVEILGLVDFFTDRMCPSLKGKPKMFFIQACQRGWSYRSLIRGHPFLTSTWRGECQDQVTHVDCGKGSAPCGRSRKNWRWLKSSCFLLTQRSSRFLTRISSSDGIKCGIFVSINQ